MRFSGWFKKRRQKKKEQESPYEAEEQKEHISEGTEEPASKPIVEKKEEPVQETPTPKDKELIVEPMVDDDQKESVSESIIEDVVDVTPELGVTSTEEPVAEQQPYKKAKKPTRTSWKLAFRGLVKIRKQKDKDKKEEKAEKKAKDRAPEPEFPKFLIFPFTLASMLLGLSILPLFPQPLPIILAFLIAFLAYQKPRIGMPIGSLTVGLGLMFNLSKMNFIATLGETEVRGVFVFIFLFLFTALPLIFNSRRAVIAINLGIIAATLLFFSQTYFLAIPLIFTAIVLFKRLSFLTVIYYGLISIPLQVMQYLNLVLQIQRWDWWIESGTSPPIFVPLTETLIEVQESMLQFRLYDVSKVVYTITDQITLDPPVMPHTANEMIFHYFDSLPGILLLLFAVIGIVSAFVFFTRAFFGKSKISHSERLLPIMSATIAVVLFFLLAVSLQGPLAFRVDVNGLQIAIATFATVLFTLPTLLIDHSPKRKATVDMIMKKTKALTTALQTFEDELDEVKHSLPIALGSFEVKTLMVRDRLNDILSKASMRLDEGAEIEKIFNELDSLNRDIDILVAELNVSVREYQIYVNCEFAMWRGMFKDIGVETEISGNTAFQSEAPLETRIDQIKEAIDDWRSFTKEIMKVAEQAYGVMRSFYDPDLPEESQSIAFAQNKLDEKETPWVALDALFNALVNWNKQYKVQISKSMKPLQSLLTTVANLSTQNGRLEQVLGDDFSKIRENSQKAESIKMDLEKRPLSVINLLTTKDIFPLSLGIARDVLSILYEKMKSKEKIIESLMPSENFLWEKNDALIRRMDSAMEATSESSNVKLSEAFEKLLTLLSHMDECVDTIRAYTDMEELLLNYPIAEMAVQNLLKEKKSVSPKDLPFEPKYAEEYLKMFYSKKFQEFSFDRTSMLLTKKT